MKKAVSLFLTAAVFLSVLGNTRAFAASADAKWSEEVTKDGWIHVVNEDGAELGYHPDSGMGLITEDGLAFKDMAGDGELYPYMDWRLDASKRAKDLASRLTLEELAGLMIHGKVAPSGKSAKDQILWSNKLQANAEKSNSFGIPVNVIAASEPSNTLDWADGLTLAATFDPDLAAERAAVISSEMRALGIHTYLGPMANLATEPRWYKVSDTFGEDPALARDLTKATANGFQSTFSDDGTDIGWGADSINAVLTDWPGAGPSEGGRAGNRWWGSFNVYPGGQFDSHLIPFVDGGLKLPGLTKTSAGVMNSNSIVWEAGSETENLSSAFNYEQNQLLRSYGFDGVVFTNWDVNGALGYGSDVEFFAPHEKILLAILAGTDQFVDMTGTAEVDLVLQALKLGADLIEGNYEASGGGATGEMVEVEYGDENVGDQTGVISADVRVAPNPLDTLLPVLNSAFKITEDMDGEETLRARLEESAVRILKNSFSIGLFENPYLNSKESLAVVSNPDNVELAGATHGRSIVMLKNDGVISKDWAGDKPTVYVPMTLNLSEKSPNHTEGEPHWTVGTKLPVEELEEYFNVITDSVADKLTGVTAEDGTVYASPDDIIRASADDVAKADFILAFMEAPMNGLAEENNGVELSAWYPETSPWDYHFNNIKHIQYYPISMQYRSYRATNDNVRQPSIAGRSIWWFLSEVYGPQASFELESRAYFGQRSNVLNGHELDLLLDVVDAAPKDMPIITVMNAKRGYTFAEFEPDVDAIFIGFDVDYSAFLPLVLGKAEPSALLPIQMPVDMAVVEGNSEDVPRDMKCYVDSMGNAYDFAFGLNWSGVIEDERTEKYGADPLDEPASSPN